MLDEQLNPIKKDIEAIKQHGASRHDLTLATNPLKNIGKITNDIKEIQMRATSMENAMNERMVNMEKQMGILQNITPRSISATSQDTTHAYHVHGKRALTAVIGNLEDFETEATAAAFIREQFANMNGPIPKNIYAKGDFRNVLFVEFGGMVERDTAVALFWIGDNTMWASQDREPAERAARYFAFASSICSKTVWAVNIPSTSTIVPHIKCT